MTTIIIMRFKAAPGREKEFEGLVAERAPTIKKTAGCLQLYLLRPVSSDEYRLVTWWSRIDDHDAWIRKETFEFVHNPKHAGLILGTVPFEVANVLKQW